MTDKEQALITKYDLLFESRLSKTEQSLDDLRETCKEIKTDLRWLLGITFAMQVGMLGLMAKGFHWLN